MQFRIELVVLLRMKCVSLLMLSFIASICLTHRHKCYFTHTQLVSILLIVLAFKQLLQVHVVPFYNAIRCQYLRIISLFLLSFVVKMKEKNPLVFINHRTQLNNKYFFPHKRQNCIHHIRYVMIAS